MTVTLPCQYFPSRLSVPRSFFRPLAPEPIDDFVGRTGCGKKQNAPDQIWGRLFSPPLGNDVECRDIISAQSLWLLDLALKCNGDGFAVERKEVSNLALVLGEAFLAPAGEYREVLYHCLGVFLLHIFHCDPSTLT